MTDAARAQEVALITAVLQSPAGYNLDFAGGWLLIRPTDQATIEVEWIEVVDEKEISRVRSFPDSELLEAAHFFVDKRHELQYGLDYEAAHYEKAISGDS